MNHHAALAILLLASCGGPEARPAQNGAVDPLHDPAPVSAAPQETAQRSETSVDVARGVKLLEAGDAKAARSAFEAARKKNASDPEAHYYLGLLADKEGDRAVAETEYAEALKNKPSLESAALNLGALYIDAGKFSEAEQVSLKALTASKKSGVLSLNLAVALASQAGKEEQATKAFADAKTASPADAMVALTHGTWLAKWKKNEEAQKRLKEARDLANGDPGILASAGFELKNIGAFADCIVALDRALEKKEAAELRTYRALCKLGTKDKLGALQDLETAVKNEPKYAPAHFYLAGRLLDEKKPVADAIAHYEQYVKLEPSGPLAQTAQERVKILKKK
jgi:Tfp pilus assembly protein PilF